MIAHRGGFVKRKAAWAILFSAWQETGGRAANLAAMAEQSRPDTEVYREIARIAVPVGLEMVVQLLLGLIDQVIVGTLGAVAIAAVGLSNSFLGVLGISLASLGAGTGILVSRAHGAGQAERTARVSGAASVLAAVLSLLVALPFLPFVGLFLHAVGAAPEVAAAARPFFQIILLELPAAVTSSVASATLRALGRAREPLVATLAAVALNTALGYALVLGVGPFPRLGLAGAAWATLAAQSVRAALVFRALYGGRTPARWELPAGLAEWRGTGQELLRLSVPLGAKDVSWSLGLFCYALLFQRLGTGTLAASRIVSTLENIFLLTSIGLMIAATTLIGQAVGRGDPDGAQSRVRALLRVGVVTGWGFGALYLGTALLLPVLYPHVTGSVRHIAFWGIAISAAFQPVRVRSIILGGGVLPSAGDTRTVVIGDALGSFALGLPLAYLLAFPLHWGVWGIFAARGVEEVFKVLLFSWRAARLRWGEVAQRLGAPALNPAEETVTTVPAPEAMPFYVPYD